MASNRPQRIRDPVHDLIEFNDRDFEQACWATIQTRPFQRLRRVKQLAFSELVYPGATHSRLAHSLGVFHTARLLARVIERVRGDAYDSTRGHVAVAAALVHDLGHGPFSHAFEDALRRLDSSRRHELRTVDLIQNTEVKDRLNEFKPQFANDVANILRSETPVDIYAAIVSSQFDADRLDYMQRDRLMTGTQHAGIDFAWLLANLDVKRVPRGQDEKELGEVETLVLTPKAIMAAEAYVLGLFQLYPTVYLHKTTRGVEKLFSEILFQVGKLVRDGSISKLGLPGAHPVVRFLANPNDVESFLRLDDGSIWGALAQLRDCENAMVQELAERLLDRRLYKAIDVTAITEETDTSSRPREAKIREALTESALLRDAEFPGVLADVAERNPYRRRERADAGLDRILAIAPSGRVGDLAEQSEVVKALKPFHRYRVYVRDDAARDAVMKIVKEAV